MNRVKKCLRNKTAFSLDKLLGNVWSGAETEFTDEEIDYTIDILSKSKNGSHFVDALSKIEKEARFFPYLWLILKRSDDNGRAMQLALETMKGAEFCGPIQYDPQQFCVFCPANAVGYVLSKAGDEKIIDGTLERCLSAKCPDVRMPAAVFLIEQDAEKGIFAMLNILLEVYQYEHDIHDSILIWLNEKGNEEIRAKIKAMAAQYAASGDTEKADWCEHAARMIRYEHPTNETDSQ